MHKLIAIIMLSFPFICNGTDSSEVEKFEKVTIDKEKRNVANAVTAGGTTVSAGGFVTLVVASLCSGPAAPAVLTGGAVAILGGGAVAGLSPSNINEECRIVDAAALKDQDKDGKKFYYSIFDGAIQKTKDRVASIDDANTVDKWERILAENLPEKIRELPEFKRQAERDAQAEARFDSLKHFFTYTGGMMGKKEESKKQVQEEEKPKVPRRRLFRKSKLRRH